MSCFFVNFLFQLFSNCILISLLFSNFNIIFFLSFISSFLIYSSQSITCFCLHINDLEMLKHRIFLVNKYVLGILLDQVLGSISIFVCCHCPLRMIIKSEPMHTPLLSPLIGFGVVLAHKFATSGYGRTFFFTNW